MNWKGVGKKVEPVFTSLVDRSLDVQFELFLLKKYWNPTLQFSKFWSANPKAYRKLSQNFQRLVNPHLNLGIFPALKEVRRPENQFQCFRLQKSGNFLRSFLSLKTTHKNWLSKIQIFGTIFKTNFPNLEIFRVQKTIFRTREYVVWVFLISRSRRNGLRVHSENVLLLESPSLDAFWEWSYFF